MGWQQIMHRSYTKPAFLNGLCIFMRLLLQCYLVVFVCPPFLFAIGPCVEEAGCGIVDCPVRTQEDELMGLWAGI